MNWRCIQLIFPLLAVLPWPAGFVFFGDMDTSEAIQKEAVEPFVATNIHLADKNSARVPVIRICDQMPSPYVKMAVATTYDGEKWLLKDVADHNVFDHLDLSRDAEIAVQNNLSPTHNRLDTAALQKAKAANDALHLSLPDNTSKRVNDLARRITEGLQAPFEKAEAIETFLRVRYGYDFDFMPAPPGWEPHDWFLFESQEGVCRHFNSAFVILSRAAGIPSRLVVGYYVEPGRDEQTVYSDQAHAWAEIKLEGMGWVAFDATPPAYPGDS